MKPISHSFKEFTAAIEQQLHIDGDGKGTWWIEDWGTRTVRWIMGWDQYRKENVANTFKYFVDQVERYHNKQLETQIYNFGEKFQHHYGKTTTAWEIDYRIKAIGYRLNAPRIELLGQDYDDIISVATEWKLNQKYMHIKTLDEADKKRFKSLSSYRAFAESLLLNKSLQEKFFQWTLRDKLEPAPFIELPATVEQIMQTRLSERLGKFDILKFDNKQKTLNLLAETGTYYNIRNLNETIILAHRYGITVKEMFDILDERETKGVGNIEVLKCGITNYNAQEFATYNPITRKYIRINLDKPNWWEQLTPAEEITIEKIQEMMPHDWKGDPFKPNGTDWIVGLGMTSDDQTDVLIRGTHSFLLVGIPTPEKKYKLYPIGVHVWNTYPQNLYEELQFVCSYQTANVVCPDETYFYSHRDIEFVPETISPAEGLKVMARVKRDILLALERRIPFNIFGKNCFMWAINILKAYIPKENLRKVCAFNPFKHNLSKEYQSIINLYHKVPIGLINPVLNTLAWFLGSHKKVTYTNHKGIVKTKCFKQHLPWDPKAPLFFNPSLLLRERRKNPAVLLLK